MGRVRQSFSPARTLRLIALTALLSLLGSAPSRAQDAGELLRLLQDSQSFRVRARAALALASVPGDPRSAAALEGALIDAHAAVRAAAATAVTGFHSATVFSGSGMLCVGTKALDTNTTGNR